MKCSVSSFLFLLPLGLATKFPINFQTCRIRSDFNKCLMGAISEALPKLANGVPDLKIPQLDPLYVPGMSIGEGEGAVHLVQNFKDIKIFGATKNNITKVDGSKIRDFRLHVETFTKSLRLEAKYNISGRILLIPIQGEGDCTITLENLNATHTSIGEKFEKRGKIYMKVKEYRMTLNPGKMVYNFENLFNGDERLGKEINRLLNENWKEVFDDVKKGYEESFGLIFGDFANRIYSKIPFKDLFLD